MNETLEQMARALFKSWFVDFDPVRAKMEGRWRPGQSLPGLPAHLYDLFPSYRDKLSVLDSGYAGQLSAPDIHKWAGLGRLRVPQHEQESTFRSSTASDPPSLHDTGVIGLVFQTNAFLAR